MNNRVFQQPSDFELEILQILWENGPSTVRFVNDMLNRNRKVGYTTSLKIMQIMLEKKLLSRDESERSHIYEPSIEQNALQDRLINKILSSAFGGSASRLVMQTLGSHDASKEELEEIRKLLEELEKKTEK
jgi:predicted transcriptional regulator